jgi:hypothetical protein
VKGSFYKELEYVFDMLPKWHVNNMLGDFSTKVGKEDVFKPIFGNESLDKITNDNGVRVCYSSSIIITDFL